MAGCGPGARPQSGGQPEVRVIHETNAANAAPAPVKKRKLSSDVKDVSWHDPYKDPWLGLENKSGKRRKIWVQWPQSTGHIYEVTYLVDANEIEMVQPWGDEAKVVKAEESP